jgi:hypothetical protein
VRYSLFSVQGDENIDTLEVEQLEISSAFQAANASRLAKPVGKWCFWCAARVALTLCEDSQINDSAGSSLPHKFAGLERPDPGVEWRMKNAYGRGHAAACPYVTHRPTVNTPIGNSYLSQSVSNSASPRIAPNATLSIKPLKFAEGVWGTDAPVPHGAGLAPALWCRS